MAKLATKTIKRKLDMSLNKQMIIFVVSILLLILIGTFGLNFYQTKSYLENQLESHAQDTATSLGLSLSSVADPEESSSMETMVNAVFDRGSYAHIALINTEGKPIYFRANSEEIAGVPEWFINIVSIQAPSAESLIQTGWIPIGKLRIKSNPELAYVKLWENTIAISIWFLIATLITIIIAYFAIKIMLSPLKKMELQAEAIVKKEYLLQEDLPSTTEFKRVVSAMNTMVRKLKSVFDRDAKMAEKLQKMAYQDKVTGLSNRTHFEMNIAPMLDEKLDASAGVMSLIRIHNLKDLNDKYGYLIGDEFIQLLAKNLKKAIPTREDLTARLNGTELITVAPTTNCQAFIIAMNTLYKDIGKIHQQLNTDESLLKISIGIIDYQPSEKRQELLARLDYAIDKAQEANCPHYESIHNSEHSDDVWMQTLDKAMKENRFLLFQQSAYTDNNDPHSKELFIRLKDADDNIQSAGYFMPAVQHLKREGEIDQLVIEMAIKYLATMPITSKTRLAINLTTFEDNTCMTSIEKYLQSIDSSQLSFETTEKLIIQNEQSAQKLITQLKSLKIKFGIDNFGSHFSNMAYLQKLRPDYIKLDAGFSQTIESDEQTTSYVSSLIDMCDSLDIEVIAMAVETKQQQQAFSKLGVKFYQGYLFNAPKQL